MAQSEIVVDITSFTKPEDFDKANAFIRSHGDIDAVDDALMELYLDFRNFCIKAFGIEKLPEQMQRMLYTVASNKNNPTQMHNPKTYRAVFDEMDVLASISKQSYIYGAMDMEAKICKL